VALIRQGWGFSAAVDQQVGGLLMWVGNTPVYLVACLAALARWYRELEPDIAYDEPGMGTTPSLADAHVHAGQMD
jgi:cytochrome c oxidase assembly factor CtaG